MKLSFLEISTQEIQRESTRLVWKTRNELAYNQVKFFSLLLAKYGSINVNVLLLVMKIATPLLKMMEPRKTNV